MALKKILISNSFGAVRRFIKLSHGSSLSYVAMDIPLSPAMKAFLSLAGANDLTNELFRYREEFKTEYLNRMRMFSRDNDCLKWWAMNFTNKNPLLTGLYKNVFYTIGLSRLIKKSEFKYLVIYSSNFKVVRKLMSMECVAGCQISVSIKAAFDLEWYLKNRFFLYPCYSVFKSLTRKLMSYVSLPKVQNAADKGKLCMIVTPLEDKSFKGPGFADVYFSSLADFLKTKNREVINAGLVSCSLTKLYSNKNKNVFALERFITLVDILKCALSVFKSSFVSFRSKGSFNVFEVDFSDFVNDEIAMALNNGQVFFNLSIYYSARNIIKKFCPSKIFYPFENRSWEKMIILAAQSSSCSRIQLTGYQHSSLTPKHTNFYLGKDEYKQIPFPGQIVTMGEVTRGLMVDYFNFPSDMVKTGCALRQMRQENNEAKEKPHKIKNILVVLASDVCEYVKMLEFLDEAFVFSTYYSVTIRPHPLIDFNKALRVYRPENLKYEIDAGPLDKSLKACDLVLYASSTVSLEAVSLGVPVMYIGLRDVLDSDPLFNMSYLKWVCQQPQELDGLIKSIDKIDENTYRQMQKNASEFSRLYCVPPSSQSMEAFIKH